MTSPGLQVGDSRARRRTWLWRLIILLILCLQPVLLFALFQRKLIYHPLREKPDVTRAANALRRPIQPIRLTTEDGLLLNGWLVTPLGIPEGGLEAALADGQPLCIWFNGNAGHRAHRLPQLSLIHKLGAHALVVDYRGYADNPGAPSEDGLASDARAVWNYAVNTLKVPPGRIILCGESLGGGVATRLAADLCRAGTPPGGLFLQATFSSLTDTGAYHYPWLPVRWVLRDRFDSLSRIADITCPIVMVHGRQDSIVPYEQGQKLFAAAPEKSASGTPKQFVELPDAGHNDIMDPAVGAVPLWSQALGRLVDNVIGPVEPTAN